MTSKSLEHVEERELTPSNGSAETARVRLSGQAAEILANRPADQTKNNGSQDNSTFSATAHNSPQRFDSKQSPKDLVEAGKIKEAPKSLDKAVEFSSLNDKSSPKISVEMQDVKEPQEKPNFVVKQNGDVEMHGDPEVLKSKNIRIVLERSAGQLDPTPEQKAVSDELVQYLSQRLKNQNETLKTDGVEVSDTNNVLSPETRKATRQPANTEGLSPETQQSVGNMSRFSGSNGGEMPMSKTNDYFPQRDVSRQPNESDTKASIKEAVAGLFNADKTAPYETIRQAEDGGYRIGRYGLSGQQLNGFLQSLGEPPDPALIDKLVKEGKLPKDFAEKLKNPEFFEKFKQFANKMDGKAGAITKEEVKLFLPNDVQEAMGSVLVDQASAKVGNNPGAISAALLSGKSPNQLTEADLNTPQSKKLSEAGQRLYDIAEAKQQSKNPDDSLKWDSNGKVSIGEGKWLDGAAGTALNRAREQAKAAGVDIQINSAGRTFEEQSELYAKLNGISAVAKPGTSNHESGRAIDIQNYEQAKPFLVANGFVHGDGNGPIPGDLWHFKYVG